jgi:L-fuconolactonase
MVNDLPEPVIVDSHQHFWNYSELEYEWIDASMPVLRRDFLPHDLAAETASCGVSRTVAVQARTSLEETRWLLDLADNHPGIAAVVGWLPLQSGDAERELAPFVGSPKLAGVREVLQGCPAGAFLTPAFHEGIRCLTRHRLTYDILIYSDQLAEACALADAHPEQVFVLDHIAKPKISAGEIEPWSSLIRELARRPNVFCKVSGMVTEAAPPDCTPENLRRYFDLVLEAFGPSRLMFGSDWPVCLLRASYAEWLGWVRGWTRDWSPDEQARFFNGTACQAYGLAH